MENKPKTCLEIGVHRGQMISLWALISKKLGYKAEIYGISPFDGRGDSVSKYNQNLDYYEDTLKNFKHFRLGAPILLKALSTDAKAKKLISSKKWDLVYIDGSHDYNLVFADYLFAKNHLSDKGMIVFDDAALFTDYNPPKFAFRGHPGPSKVAKEFAMKEMDFIGQVGHNLIFRRRQK